MILQNGYLSIEKKELDETNNNGMAESSSPIILLAGKGDEANGKVLPPLLLASTRRLLELLQGKQNPDNKLIPSGSSQVLESESAPVSALDGENEILARPKRANKFYAVARGRQTGVFDNRKYCNKLVQGYDSSLVKCFPSRAEAEKYLREFAADDDRAKEQGGGEVDEVTLNFTALSLSDENGGSDENEEREDGAKTKNGSGEEASGGDSSRRKEKTPEKVDSKKEDQIFQSLKRVSGLGDLLKVALDDILNIKHRRYEEYNKEKETLSRGEKRDRRKEQRGKARSQALESQRKKLSRQLNVGDEQGKGHGNTAQEEAEEEEDPWTRLARMLNSVRLLAPILLKILFHERRQDRTLKIGEASLPQVNKRGKQRCWLLGKTVFDLTTDNMYQSILCKFKIIVSHFGVSGEKITHQHADFCQDCIDEVLESTLLLQRGKALPKWGRSHPFGELSEKDQLALDRLSLRLDSQYKLIDSRNKEQHDLYLESIRNLHTHVSKLMKARFNKNARISIYGSCLSDLSLGKSSDVDMSLYLGDAASIQEMFFKGQMTPEKYQKQMKQLVYQVCRKLEHRDHEFRDMQPIVHARVPVVRGTYTKANNPHTEDGAISFDICFLNDIAVANSSLLREYSLVDCRVRHLMMAVKRWAKENEISSAVTNTVSSYTWQNLVIFYLQCIAFVPNLQCPALIDKVGKQRDPQNEWHSVDKLDTFFLTWEEVCVSKSWTLPASHATTSVTSLLYGFFHFYAESFPWALYAVSIKRGKDCALPKTTYQRCSHKFCVEDPFETHDSHRPHDLGSHADDIGTTKIIRCLQESEMHLRKTLLNVLEEGKKCRKAGSELSLGAADSLLSKSTPWPTPKMCEDGDTNQGKKGRRRSGKRSQGHTARQKNTDQQKSPKVHSSGAKQRQLTKSPHNNGSGGPRRRHARASRIDERILSK